jgi:hypothetical protein
MAVSCAASGRIGLGEPADSSIAPARTRLVNLTDAGITVVDAEGVARAMALSACGP